MNRVFSVILVVLILFTSCNNSIEGRVDYRQDDKNCYPFEDTDMAIVVIDGEYSINQKDTETKGAYLINESIDKMYEFTIKQVETIDDTIVNHTTIKVKLSPADEKRLGCTNYNDVIINTDSTIPPRIRHNVLLSYKCTGQRLISNSKELDHN